MFLSEWLYLRVLQCYRAGSASVLTLPVLAHNFERLKFSLSLVLFHYILGVFNGLEGFRQIGSFIVVCEQLIVCVQYIKSCLIIVDVMSKRRCHV